MLRPLRVWDTLGGSPPTYALHPGPEDVRRGVGHWAPVLRESARVKEISSDAIDILMAHFAKVTSPLSLAVFFQKSGAMSRGPHDKTAFGHRDARYALTYYLHVARSQGIGAAYPLGARVIGGDRAVHERRRIHQRPGAGSGGRESRIKAGYGVNYERLVVLKNKYDPINLFCHNQNITPNRIGGTHTVGSDHRGTSCRSRTGRATVAPLLSRARATCSLLR